MQFGASTYFLQERSVTEALDVIARLGYATAEIWMEHYWSSGERPRTIGRRARALGLGLTVHAASHDVNILSSNPGICRVSKQQIRSSMKLAREIGATVVVVHPGMLSASRGDSTAAWEKLLETTSMLDDWAQEEDLMVGLENMEKRRKEIFALPQDLGRLFNHSWQKVRLTLDLAHMQTHMDALTYLRQIQPQWICHIHLSDNDPTTTHLPLGHGQLPISDLLNDLRTHYDGIISLEGYVPGEGERILTENMAYLRRLGFTGD
jgi:sugar phosphate isomerase/epimerase